MPNTTSPADKTTNTAATAASAAADTIAKVEDKARDLKDSVIDSAQTAVSATRDAANASIDKAQERVEQWRSNVDPAMSELAAKAQALAERSIHYCADTSTRLRKQMDKCTDSTTRYVTEQPGKSIAIAATIGAALALASAALLRRRGD